MRRSTPVAATPPTSLQAFLPSLASEYRLDARVKTLVQVVGPTEVREFYSVAS